MNSEEYIAATRRTRPPQNGNPSMHFLQSGMGMASEAGEILGLIEKTYCQGHDLDQGRLKKELGDLMWYAAMLMDEFDWTFEEVFAANIEKLQKRFPEKFSAAASVRRVDADE